MGKGEVTSGKENSDESTNYLAKSTSEATKMLEAALLQMDGILSGEASSEWKDPIKDVSRNLVTLIRNSPSLPPPPDPRTVDILMKWLQPSCLLGYARVVALQGSLPNVCAAANMPHLPNVPFHNVNYNSTTSELSQHVSKDMSCSSGFGYMSPLHHSCNCHPQQQQQSSICRKDHQGSSVLSKSTNSSQNPGNSKATGASLDRRKRRHFKSKIDRDHRAKSQSDLLCCGDGQQQLSKSRHCSSQQLYCANNFHANNHSNGNAEERLRKLENERSALHMEISILSEQVDAQSGKIVELENALQEKKDALRHMEESLQKEVLSRSALETQKLELLSSLSEMKLRLAGLEHENLALRNTNPLTNGERFSRHAGHYSSLPRPPTSAKKGVVFAAEEKTVITDNITYVKRPPPKPFVQFSIDEVSEWLSQLGLESYTSELKRWGATGTKLLEATHVQVEKELDIRNSLHRKKLLYAVESEKTNGAGFLGSDKMDNAAVLRWLDDIGLPQHKEAFHNAKVDGRVLHRLTTDDLASLNVTAQLHAASLRRGIQVLRDLNFEYDNLERRSLSENGLGPHEMTSPLNSKRVWLWTNHRVMEWLRVVDLAEYAPNMRGSGVHGGLMVYEPRFTSELLATLLSIPPAKTLLRRHLTTHFNGIIGRDVVQQKREIENTLGFVPLTLTARLKVPKKTQFTLKRKKSKNEVDFANLVCPLEKSPPGTPPTSTTSVGSSNTNSSTP